MHKAGWPFPSTAEAVQGVIYAAEGHEDGEIVVKKRYVNPRTVASSAREGFSQAVRVGNTIYVSGQTSHDARGRLVGEGDLEAQTTKAFENISEVLKASGATLKNVVKLNIYTSSPLKDYPVIQRVRRRYFPKGFPAATGVRITGLAVEGALVEIEATAVVDG